jgi:hypothetical protein
VRPLFKCLFAPHWQTAPRLVNPRSSLAAVAGASASPGRVMARTIVTITPTRKDAPQQRARISSSDVMMENVSLKGGSVMILQNAEMTLMRNQSYAETQHVMATGVIILISVCLTCGGVTATLTAPLVMMRKIAALSVTSQQSLSAITPTASTSGGSVMATLTVLINLTRVVAPKMSALLAKRCAATACVSTNYGGATGRLTAMINPMR